MSFFQPTITFFSFWIYFLTTNACDGTDSKQIGTCLINYCVNAGWYDWEWKYDCEAIDTESGISSWAKHYESSEGACHHATLQLFDIINDCNCEKKRD